MRYLRWLSAWALYGVGCMVCHVMEWFTWEGPSRVLYPIYNRLMLWSCETQGRSGFGPWDPEGGLPDNGGADHG